MYIEFKDFYIDKPVYVDGRVPDELSFALYKHTENKIVTFVVAKFYWNPKDDCWEFESTEANYLKYYTEGLSEWLLDVMKMLEHNIKKGLHY